MRSFTLQFEDDDLGESKTIEFESEDGHEAFAILEHEPRTRRVELHEGGELRRTIIRTRPGSWQLG